MRTARQLTTDAQSHTPVVAVFHAPTGLREQKCFCTSCLLCVCMGVHEKTCTKPTTRYFQMVVMIMVNKKLREHRQRAGIPLEILAYKARVSPRTLWRWERWNCTPRRWESIQRVAAVLGVQPEDLLDDEQGGDHA
jgi:DNA-binding XRE family transcriptional regulator